jgi:hypothetical protein
MAGGTHRSLKDEATTAWSVGLDVARWRAACATGSLLATEGHEGDGGPAMHFTLMIARMLKTREEDDATSSPILASRSVGPTYVSGAAVMTLGGNDPRPTVVFTTPGTVSFATLGGDGEDAITRVDLIADDVPVAVLPLGPNDCAVVCSNGSVFRIVDVVVPVATRLLTVQPPVGSQWWSATMPFPNELAMFNNTRTIHTVPVDLSAPAADAPAANAVAHVGAVDSKWQRATSCSEGLWAAADSSDACDFLFVIFDERQRNLYRTPASSRTSESSQSSTSSTETVGALLVTFVVLRPPREQPTLAFADDPRRRDMTLSVRLVSMAGPPILHPGLPRVGAMLNSLASWVRCGDGGVATLVLASSLAPELVLLTIDLHAHEVAFQRRGSGSVSDGDTEGVHDDETWTDTMPLCGDASHATSVSWVGPLVRHPQWHDSGSWRNNTLRLPPSAVLTAASIGCETQLWLHACGRR